jgi:2-oxoglutarate dehydrogenase E1 component
MKLRDLLARLKATYTGSIGAEFMHISEVEQRQWIYKKAGSRRWQLPAGR